jgi:hypothetical protein
MPDSLIPLSAVGVGVGVGIGGGGGNYSTLNGDRLSTSITLYGITQHDTVP